MKVRFQADADLHQMIVTVLVRREPSVRSLLLAWQDRVIRTRWNVPPLRGACWFHMTRPQHFAEFIQHQQSAWLLLVPQHLPYAIAVEELLLIWAASEAKEWINRIGG